MTEHLLNKEGSIVREVPRNTADRPEQATQTAISHASQSVSVGHAAGDDPAASVA
jgi:hypothetical protein